MELSRGLNTQRTVAERMREGNHERNTMMGSDVGRVLQRSLRMVWQWEYVEEMGEQQMMLQGHGTFSEDSGHYQDETEATRGMSVFCFAFSYLRSSCCHSAT